VDAMRNKWIIEISEMEVVRKAEINALKAFLSRNEDRVRLAYRKNAENFPRQCIFIGTINPDEGGGYLRDTTGNRRFWPVLVPEGQFINVDGFTRDVDQIWAEAVFRYQNGETNLHIEDDATMLLAAEEVEKRRPKDSWRGIIENWISKLNDDGSVKKAVTGAELYCDALDGIKTHYGGYEAHRIAQIMKELGWVKSSFYLKETKKAVSGYVRPKGD
jgi:predicted P-loop ATPase